MVVMQVAGLTLDEQTKAPILILKNPQGDEVLPIWIGAMEAMAISVMINAVSVPRPLTHDLLLNALHATGADLLGIEIVALREGTYYAELELLTADRRHKVDCRPSDAVALALRAKVPIMVHRAVLDAAARDRMRPSPTDAAHLIEPADAAAEMMRRAEALRTLHESGHESDADSPEQNAEQDEKGLEELLKLLEPDTKTRM